MTAYHLSVLAQYVGVDWVEKAVPSCDVLSSSSPTLIRGVAPITVARPDQLTFFEHGSHMPLSVLENTQAGAVIVHPDHVSSCPVHALVSVAPKVVYAKLAQRFFVTLVRRKGVDATALIGARCQIADSAYIGPHCILGEGAIVGPGAMVHAGSVLGEDVVIGEGTCLWPKVTVYRGVRIGQRCVLHSGTVVGSDGFGWVKDMGRRPDVAAGLGEAVSETASVPQWIKVPQLGGVCIGDDVEIGANTAIDRGAMQDTVIASGVKIDNLVHIAHNVCVGERTLIAACAGIAGSAKIGADCMIAGGVGVSDHVTIPAGTVITGMSTVSQSIREPGHYSSFLPVQPHRAWVRTLVHIRKLSALFSRFKRLEEKTK